MISEVWESDDYTLIEPLMTSTNQYIRRAAYIAYGRNNFKGFGAKVKDVLTDKSELVKFSIPLAVVFKYNSRVERKVFFDHKTIIKKSVYQNSFNHRSKGPLPMDYKAAFEQLLKDGGNKLKLESYFALMISRSQFDIKQFVMIIESYSDKSIIVDRLDDFFQDSFRYLGKSFLVLLPYVESELYNRKEVYKHFGLANNERIDSGKVYEKLVAESKSGLQAQFVDVNEELEEAVEPD